MDRDFWQGKRVLVTGHTGFKGSWLTLLLHYLGAEVFGFSDRVEPGGLFDLAELSRVCHHQLGNINDEELLSKRVQQVRPDVVFHLAAQPLVSEGYKYPLLTLETNILGTARLLENFRQWQSRLAIVVISSDKCYRPDNETLGFIESDPLGGHDPYSCSKAGCEMVVESYNASYFSQQPLIGLASARAGNVIGGGDYAENRIVPDVMAAIIANEPVALRHPTAVRPWQHVLDALYGYLLLAENLYANPDEYSGPWNFGPSGKDACSVGELVARCYSQMGLSFRSEKQMLGFSETQVLLLDSGKSSSKLQWKPRWTLDMTIKRLLEWYVGVANDMEPRLLTEQQIIDFLEIEGTQYE
ncbi:CDP-glucose 4,6-dehydratase [Shewanella marisflavi]|uniref:CDP-glucose 4,6-dehydratase n=1 Tax=Shewanella marisflavi TaxID=260364 RepID=UPI00200C092B|nr:CDP-glucose 4,6-dehydratase [Shewanella marisflavi]MCL1040837.1 CDP-glucose 4,6-dehydratase [Shewanella marisflavi]